MIRKLYQNLDNILAKHKRNHGCVVKGPRSHKQITNSSLSTQEIGVLKPSYAVKNPSPF